MKRTSFPRTGLVAALLMAASVANAVTDFNNDGYDDVWQQRDSVTVSSYPLNGDNDGDGVSNLDESIAATKPNDPLDCLKMSDMTVVGSDVQIAFKTRKGKRYTIETSTASDGPTWTTEGSAITGNGLVLSITVPLGSGSAPKFYRVKAEDQDSDGDGLSDWAEAALGTDPLLASSPNNASGGVANDGEVLRSIMSITTSVVTASAYEKEDTAARIRLTRSYGSMPLSLSFTKAGNSNAAKGSASVADYILKTSAGATIGGSSISMAAGATQYDMLIAPVQDDLDEVPEMLRLSFRAVSPSTWVTTPAGATREVHIRDAQNTAANRRLFVAYFGREGGAATTATGYSTLMLQGDNAAAVVNTTFSNLTSEQSASHLHGAPVNDPQSSGPVIEPLELGQVVEHPWTIVAEPVTGWMTDQAALDALFDGYVYVNVHTANYLSGEIRGNYGLANGSVADPPPPDAPPTYGSTEWPALTGSDLDRDIARFLTQATYGPTPESIQEVKDLITANGNNALAGYEAWINRQMNLSQTPSPSLVRLVQAADVEEFVLRGNKPITWNNDPQFEGTGRSWRSSDRTWINNSGIRTTNSPSYLNRRREWWTLVLQSKDQLRQRMAFALSEIAVVSETAEVLRNYHYGTAHYWDMLAENAFGRYRQILSNVSRHPQMGYYLSHLRNQKASGSISPDENYAREIMQLFSIGLVLRHQDGSLKLSSEGLPIPTYDQEDIRELARVFTGLSFGKIHATLTAPTHPNPSQQTIGALQDTTDFFKTSTSTRYWQGPWMNWMKMFDVYHDHGQKVLLNGKVGHTVVPARTDNAGVESEGMGDVTLALDMLSGFRTGTPYDGHPNTPVFISRLLIQRFTTSNPSAGYLYRVAQKYKDSSGNLGEVVKAILLDHEARSLQHADQSVASGKVKEPLLRYAAFLRATQFYTGAPLARLSEVPVNFTSLESPVTTPYPASELNKFPSGALRFRFDSTASQVAMQAPSVFNWFLPDYTVPGPLANAGLVAPEMQIVTETRAVSVANLFNSMIHASSPPTTKPGLGLGNFFNRANYATSAGTPLTVPQHGVDAGYFSATTFDASPGGTQNPGSIDNGLDNLVPIYQQYATIYTDVYTASITAQYAPEPVPASPGSTQKQAAHAEALKAVLDHCDLIFTGGYLKAKYGGVTTANPRQSIITRVSNIGANNRHTSDAANFATDARMRSRNILWLIANSPQAAVLK